MENYKITEPRWLRGHVIPGDEILDVDWEELPQIWKDQILTWANTRIWLKKEGDTWQGTGCSDTHRPLKGGTFTLEDLPSLYESEWVTEETSAPVTLHPLSQDKTDPSIPRSVPVEGLSSEEFHATVTALFPRYAGQTITNPHTHGHRYESDRLTICQADGQWSISNGVVSAEGESLQSALDNLLGAKPLE